MKSMDRLSNVTDDQKLQVQFAVGAFGCVDADQIIYISTPISSGKRLYDYMKKNGFRTPAEAKVDKDAFFKSVIEPNIQASLAEAGAWTAKTKGAIIAPADFEKCRGLKDVKWTQDTFMAMWLAVIDNKATGMVMQDGWAYSDGAAEEYLHAICMQAGRRGRNNIEVMDTSGKLITLDEGIRTLAEAFIDLHQQGLYPEGLAKTMARLLLLEERYSTEQDYGQSSEPRPLSSYSVSPSLPDYDRKSFLAIKKEVMNILDADYNEILTSLETMKSIEYTPMNILVRQEEEIPSAIVFDSPKAENKPAPARKTPKNTPPKP